MGVAGEEAEASRGGVSGGGGAGDLIPSSTPARGVRRGRAPVPTLVGGTGKGRERPRGGTGRFGGRARWAGLAASWAVWSRGVPFLFFFFCLLLLYFLSFYFCFIFVSYCFSFL